MSRTFKLICVIMGLVCALQGVITNLEPAVSAKEQTIKGVWAATVYSLDYPKTPTQNSKDLKSWADNLVESASSLGYTDLFFQVRPSGDAFYKSKLFPWSKYLTGSQGLEPTEDFDPLWYITDAAHKKGLRLHAWINPFRVTASEKDNENQSTNSIANKYPHLVIKHTDGKLYLNPGEPEAIELVISGVLEIIKNYPVDGIHLDDYFYPSSAFPDAETFSKYGGDFSDIGDWRRSNTTELIKKLKAAIDEVDPLIEFSVSPCGIWANKPSHSEGTNTGGKQSYFDYYADTRLWAQENLIDTIIPQIYWNIGYSLADFEELCKWWDSVVKDSKTRLVIGQATYRVADETSPQSPWYGENGLGELLAQKRLLDSLDNISGYVHYRLGSIEKGSPLEKCVVDLNTKELPVFTDTKDFPWAEDAIERLYKAGVVKGMGDGSFGGSREVSRGDFMVMLVRQTGQKVPFTQNFSDVTPEDYFYNEIGIAKALGFAEGRENNLFDPYGKITREDMATLVYRVLSKSGKIKDADAKILYSSFSDGKTVSNYAQTAVASLVKEKILGGYETGEFKPKGRATRAEVAVMLDRLSEIL